jgi:4a-hydroxytetrahydrobiopterin dehydratase
MADLKHMQCEACSPGTPPVSDEESANLQKQIPEWSIVERDGVRRLERVFMVKDFATALAFANKIGEIAEEEGHHPALQVEWGKVGVIWWTHSIGGLHLNDFIMAAKTDQIYKHFD